MQFDGAFYCDKCGSELVLRSGAKGFFWACPNYPRCKFTQDAICPKCKGELKRRKGPFGIFLGCANYPTCEFTKNL